MSERVNSVVGSPPSTPRNFQTWNEFNVPVLNWVFVELRCRVRETCLYLHVGRSPLSLHPKYLSQNEFLIFWLVLFVLLLWGKSTGRTPLSSHGEVVRTVRNRYRQLWRFTDDSGSSGLRVCFRVRNHWDTSDGESRDLKVSPRPIMSTSLTERFRTRSWSCMGV